MRRKVDEEIVHGIFQECPILVSGGENIIKPPKEENTIANGKRNIGRSILKSIKQQLRNISSLIERKLGYVIGTLRERIQNALGWNLSQDSEGSAFVVENLMLDSSASTTLTEMVENIAWRSAVLHESFIETLPGKVGLKDLRYRFSVSTATWEDNSTAVNIKYVLTN